MPAKAGKTAAAGIKEAGTAADGVITRAAFGYATAGITTGFAAGNALAGSSGRLGGLMA